MLAARIKVSMGPVSHEELISVELARDMAGFYQRFRQDGETPAKFLERMLRVLKNLMAPRGLGERP